MEVKTTMLVVLAVLLTGCANIEAQVVRASKGYCATLDQSERLIARARMNDNLLDGTGITVHVHCPGDSTPPP